MCCLALRCNVGGLGRICRLYPDQCSHRNQDSKNTFLKAEIAILDKQLEQIKRLKEQTQALLARKQVIENLQRDRGETVYLLSELVKQVPEGVYQVTEAGWPARQRHRLRAIECAYFRFDAEYRSSLA